jgi:hypothetical protein
MTRPVASNALKTPSVLKCYPCLRYKPRQCFSAAILSVVFRILMPSFSTIAISRAF